MRRILLSMILVAALLAPWGMVQRGPFVQAAQGQSAPQAPPTRPRYTVTDLGTLGGGSEALAISENGLVAGTYSVGANPRAFLWKDGVMQGLGTLGGNSSEGRGVNDDGKVVGYSDTGTGYSGAFIWQNGSMQNLGTLGGNGPSLALGINNSGQVVGVSVNSTPQAHAFLWNGGMTDLGALGDGASYAYGVNEAGQAVGWAQTGTYPAESIHAVRWNGSIQDLGTGGWAHAQALAINNNGQVVGNLANISKDDAHAFVSQGGGLQDLGGTFSFAYDINDDGLIVGESGQQAVLWENGAMKNLSALLPAGSGWSLRNARAINNRGQIVGKGTFNGQTRAYLLSPNAYYWTNPAGGSWRLSTNWDPKGIPGSGDTAIFDLGGQFAINVATVSSAATGSSASNASEAALASSLEINRLIISSTVVVDFNNLNMALTSDTPEEPGIKVNYGSTANVNSGAATMTHAVVGGETTPSTANPPIAHLQVFNSGTTLTGSGRLTIGDLGAGDLFVANGAHLTSGESRLGGLLVPANGTAVVGGNGSLWQTGNIAVGFGVSGTLTIENGGRVDSNDAYVSYGVLSEDSKVTVDGAGPLTTAHWALLGNLNVGQTWFGSVEVLSGGQLDVSQNVYIKNGALTVDGRTPNATGANLNVDGSVFVGGAGQANLLALWNMAWGSIDGDLIIGKDGPGAAILWGDAHIANPTMLEVVNPQAGLCAIGREFDGGVSLDAGGLLRCQTIQLGQAGTGGFGSLTVDGGMVRALDVLRVGSVGGGAALLEMMNNALVATTGTYIAPNGAIAGAGKLAVGSLGLVNDGILEPGIAVMYPLRIAAAPQSIDHAQAPTATLEISGTVTFGPTGRLEIPIAGTGAGQYGRLTVTGGAALGGVLALDFGQGFAPKKGDIFAVLAVTGSTTGAFDKVEVGGLAPGFTHRITSAGGQVTVEALSDGVALPTARILLPVVKR